jgi:hypothetical protein
VLDSRWASTRARRASTKTIFKKLKIAVLFKLGALDLNDCQLAAPPNGKVKALAVSHLLFLKR